MASRSTATSSNGKAEGKPPVSFATQLVRLPRIVLSHVKLMAHRLSFPRAVLSSTTPSSFERDSGSSTTSMSSNMSSAPSTDCRRYRRNGRGTGVPTSRHDQSSNAAVALWTIAWRMSIPLISLSPFPLSLCLTLEFHRPDFLVSRPNLEDL